MPTASNWHGAFALSIGHWQQIKNKMAAGTYSGCAAIHGNGQNETTLATRAHISGLNGLNTNFFGGASGCSIVEADVEMANDMNPLPDDESFWGWTNNDQGQIVLTHELGHALGLQHFEGFDVMRAFTPLPLTGGNFAQPYGDDANGIRFLYGGSSTNLFASAQKLFSNAIVATTSAQATNPSQNCQTFPVCRGQAIDVTYTVANNGSSSKTSGFRIYVNNSPSPGTGWNMWSGSATVNAGNQFTETRTLNVPSVSNGIYWILWEIDTGNTVTEFYETDNTVHSCMTLNVTC
jgi:hypothetical protein